MLILKIELKFNFHPFLLPLILSPDDDGMNRRNFRSMLFLFHRAMSSK